MEGYRYAKAVYGNGLFDSLGSNLTGASPLDRGSWIADGLESAPLGNSAPLWGYGFAGYRSGSLADRIFGRQLGEKFLLLHQSERLAGERKRIHSAHLGELNDMRNDLLNRLAFLRRPYSVIPGSQSILLERLLLQVESERHREECAFWKDMAEVQREFFESAFAYQAARERRDLLGGLESADG